MFSKALFYTNPKQKAMYEYVFVNTTVSMWYIHTNGILESLSENSNILGDINKSEKNIMYKTDENTLYIPRKFLKIH